MNTSKARPALAAQTSKSVYVPPPGAEQQRCISSSLMHYYTLQQQKKTEKGKFRLAGIFISRSYYFKCLLVKCENTILSGTNQKKRQPPQQPNTNVPAELTYLLQLFEQIQDYRVSFQLLLQACKFSSRYVKIPTDLIHTSKV